MLTSGFGVLSVCMKIVRRPAGQVGCTDKSDDRNGLIVGLECLMILRGVNTAGLAATWNGLAATTDKCFDLNPGIARFNL